MAKSIHEQASEIIAKVIDLPYEEAIKKIDSECKDNDTLKEEVLSLFNEIFEEENNKSNQIASPSQQTTRRIGKDDTLLRSKVISDWTKVFFSNKRNRLILIIVFLITLFSVGWVVGNFIRDNILKSERAEKVAMLNTSREILDRWIFFEKTKLKSVATNPDLVRMVKKMDSIENLDDSHLLLRNSQTARDLTKWLQNARQWGDYGSMTILSNSAPKVLFNTGLIDSLGVTSLFNVDLGEKVYQDYLKARNGEIVFIPPTNDYDLLTNLNISFKAAVWITFICPIYDEDNVVIGLIVGSYLAKDEFSDILQISKHGKTSETYAFNNEGTMLSASRFTADLRKTYLLDYDSTAETLYRVVLKDPQVNIIKGLQPEKSEAELPYTKIVQLALNHLEMEDSIFSGAIMKPYRDYRGIEVIGAYLWLPEYGFGLITEEDYKEALSSLVYFDYTFIGLFTIILILSFLLYNSNVRIARFGRKMEDFEQLGQYRLREKLGEGGFGQVYRAEHHFLKTPVAIKLLKKEFIGTDMLDRFQKEVIVTSSLSHPNTVKVIDYGTTKSGQFYYVMEFLNGISLEKLLQMEDDFNVGRGIHILLQACLSLEEAHKKGLIHRDIKPANIMVCNQGGSMDLIKVLDFGLVKNVDATVSQQTQINRIGGTPMFMAPERLRDPFHTDQRVDIYAIGAVGLYMFSGQYLVELISQKMLAGQDTMQGNFDTQLINRSDIPDELKRLLTECVHFNPEKRPKNISDLIETLESLQRKHPWSRKDANDWWKNYDVYA